MSNPFALLQDEGASDEESSPPQVTAKPTTQAKASTPAQRNVVPGQQQPRGKPREDRPARKVFNEKSTNDPVEEPTKNIGKGQRGGKSGNSRARGTGRFDRHSNTNRTDSDKQEHQAWGGDDGKRELENEREGAADARADQSGLATPIDGFKDGAATDEPSASPAPAAIEEEDKTQTYEEYLAARESRLDVEKLGLNSLSLRKANEGADDSQWKNAKELVKEQDDETFITGSKEKNTRKRQQKEGKTFLEVETRYTRPNSDRGGRGRGRGGPRGRGGNFAPRESRQQQQRPIDTSDANAFPKLG